MMNDIIKLNGKKVVITGAGSGIGRETAKVLSEQGAKVVMLDLNQEGLDETKALLTGEGHITRAIDLTDFEALPELVKGIIVETGAVDGLVHCAGISSRKPLNVLRPEGFSKVMDVNFYSFEELTRLFTKKGNMNDGGSIVVMSSISSIRGYKAKTEYCVSKAAVDAFVRCMALELAPKRIRINSVMAAEVLKTGAYTINGYADDGVTVKVDTISFGTVQTITPLTDWDQAGATIYADIKNASEMVQENAGMVPTVALVGKNIGEYLLNNTEIMKWLSVPNNDNLSVMSIQPRITSPQVMRIGFIASLNLEVFAYMETYQDDSGNVVPFLGDNDVIVGVPGRGRQLHGAVNLINDDETGFETYSGLYVPKYAASKNSNTMSLTVYSRFLLAPEFMDDWVYIKAKA